MPNNKPDLSAPADGDPSEFAPPSPPQERKEAKLGSNASSETRLEDRALRLAESHVVSRRHKPSLWHRLWTRLSLPYRLRKQKATLRNAHEYFRQLSDAQLPLPHAAEWLLDNYYVVQQELRQARGDMPTGNYYRRLPKLGTPPQEGYPRVYALAQEFIERCEGPFDPERVVRFVHAYQQITPLTTGELWALPTMLRLGILERLTQTITRVRGVLEWNIEEHPTSGSLPHDPANDAIAANCIRSLHALATQDWDAFFESVSRVEEVLRCDPANIYAYMDPDTRDRYRHVVEEVALAAKRDEEEVAWAVIELAMENLTPEMTDFSLWGAPSKLKPDSTAPTAPSTQRDSEQMSHSTGSAQTHSTGSGQAQNDSSQRGESLSAETEWRGLSLPRDTHIGFYLRDAGRTQLEAHLGHRPPLGARLRRWTLAHPTPVYLGGIFLLTSIILLGLVYCAFITGGTLAQRIGAGLLGLLPATTVVVNLVNWLITNVLPPRVLPKMDFQKGIPAECSSMVVVPTLLTDANEVQSLLQQLELHFLRNADSYLYFALLTDFVDAPHKHMPGEDTLLEQIMAGVQTLNSQYGQRGTGPFYLFHRERQWNPGEGCWMGWERKRGKLVELNRLLGGTQTSYNVRIGNLDVLPQIKYVITLDADTILPRDGARRLVATMAHPLNRAEFDPESSALVAGYTVLQPRVEIEPLSASHSLFTRIFSGDTGFDLYSCAVSDVYQDLFDEGIYTGKGIYDVAAFDHSLDGRIPDNALLSHDLFEGIHGHVGLTTDVILYEDYPSHYLAHVRRLHRWVRGDWQLLPWLWPKVPHANGGRIPNDLSVIDRWKILDNLRRSLLAPALMALLVAGWLWLPRPALAWTLVGAIALATPVLTSAATTLRRAIHSLRRVSLVGELHLINIAALRWLLALTFLPYETLVMLDAFVTTLVRLFITRKRLLQWTTAAHTIRLFGIETKMGLIWRRMGGVSLLALLSLLALSLAQLVKITDPMTLLAATPLLLLWTVSPYVAYTVGRPIVRKQVLLSADQHRQLRRLARRMWLYFEQFVGPDDHWLPPDHFQEDPRGLVARRTSPTNIGLLLLSTLAAYDMGYVGSMDLALRLRPTLESMSDLAWYRGHFLNWYDTRNLEPLLPRYISTVDSGNLAGCLVILAQGLQDVLRTPILRWERLQGVLDTVDVLTETVGNWADIGPETEIVSLQNHLDHIRQRVLAVKDSPGDWMSLLAWLEEEGWSELERLLFSLVASDSYSLDAATLRDLRVWAGQVRYQLSRIRPELNILLPWLVPLSQPPALFAHSTGSGQAQSDTDPAIADAWQALVDALPLTPTLDTVPTICRTGRARLDRLRRLLVGEASRTEQAQEALAWCRRLIEELNSACMAAEGLVIGYQDLGEQAEKYFQAMDFSFLFDPHRQVFHIGYNVEAEKLDSNYYDLLASEARIASLLAIAKGDVPQSHWMHIGRPITRVGGARSLLSWGGTMFEYLMPTLLMHSHEDTLLGQSCRAAVDHQIAYARQKGVPWGISESGYYRFDANRNYQYRGFGVPGLGLRRGLKEDLVISPYASLLALAIRPQAVMENIARLTALQMLGRYGFYEAIDYTRSRLSAGQKSAIVHSYMVHHHGMSLLSITNYLQDKSMIRRFHADPRVQSVQLLMQEQVPQQAPIQYPHPEEVSAVVHRAPPPVTIAPWRVSVEAPIPQVHVLSNGRYSVLITGTGGGYSSWQGTHPKAREVALTRWRTDTTRDNWGTWIYVQDRDNGTLWSAGYQPTGSPPDSQEVLFDAHKAEFRRRDDDISLCMEITVPPDDDVEIRRITLINHSDQPRRLTLTSYGEVVLAPQSADRRHPAFNNLFIESGYQPELNGLFFRRRPRSDEEDPVHMAHMLVVEREQVVTGAHESDRARFLGRGRTVRSPAALVPTLPHSHTPTPPHSSLPTPGLSGTTGATLDPIMALGQELELQPYATMRVAYITLAAASRQEALTLARHYQAWSRIRQAFDRARAHSELELRRLNLPTHAIECIQQLLSVLLYHHAALRADSATLAANTLGQSGLWPYAISGDYPILLVRIGSEEEMELVREALQAHAYWRNRQIKIDLVIVNELETAYDQRLHDQLHRLIARMHSDIWLNLRGGIFVLRSDQMNEASRVLLETAARAILDGDKGSLADQVGRQHEPPPHLPPFIPTLSFPKDEATTPPLPRPTDLLFDNGLGGFSADGREYVIYLEPGQWTPAPWVNVVANPDFGFLVSEAGSGYTWAGNSGENRLTPWRNDPVTDAPSEALYLRDEDVGHIWSPTLLPAGAPAPYLVRHGAGYSVFEHHSHGLKQRLRVFAIPDAPVKVIHLQLENTWNRNRRITATLYVEWVLGTNRDTHQQYIVPEFDAFLNVLLARNPYNAEFSERVAFLSASKEPHGLTTDRTEFLGYGGTYRHPAALNRVGLTSRVQAGLDPCAALQVHVWLGPSETEDVFFLLGQGANKEEVLQLVKRYQDTAQVEAAWEAVNEFWDDLLSAVTVRTPDPAMDLLLNRWLLYQALACRVWGRSALYQSSGAFGYRDQLQDVMALVHAAPDLVRDHILQAARHQFEAGDVLHWWHPPSGRGVRTRCSDDLLWLPFVTAHYVTTTGDESILAEEVPFLKGSSLEKEEKERYGLYEPTAEVYTLYEHCRRALEKGMTAGQHGLPLIGSHDWNDGLSHVGIEGRGESVWLGWFLHTTLTRFASVCERVSEREGMGNGEGEYENIAQATAYRQQARELSRALEEHGWDGEWYRRAYYDDGTPLGSAENAECQIDSIAQSWAVLSGAADPMRAAQAMESVADRLVRHNDQLILLFTPPFDKTRHDPGYIKGYLPGIRENGGQYTHAALWTVWAFAELGQGDRAEALFWLLNPIYHSDTPEKAMHHRVEPYVIAADIYSVEPHVGRGGWTWYTGSAGWMVRLGLEAILGLQRAGKVLRITPCIPIDWPGYELTYRDGKTSYRIRVENPSGVNQGVRQVTLDGDILPSGDIPLLGDGKQHEVRVLMGERKETAEED